jgi:hypothetical protein
MAMRPIVTSLTLAVALSCAAALPAAAHGDAAALSPHNRAELARVRADTAAYHDVQAAIAAGYGPFADSAGILCIDHPPDGAMGIHYVNGALVGDDRVDAGMPEALIYEPQADGTLRLVGMEYIVFQDAWHADPARTGPPTLFGQTFHAGGADNRYGIPAYYALHLWLWRHNPSGQFEDWNPKVSCS